jgi:hypothetical protein
VAATGSGDAAVRSSAACGSTGPELVETSVGSAMMIGIERPTTSQAAIHQPAEYVVLDLREIIFDFVF